MKSVDARGRSLTHPDVRAWSWANFVKWAHLLPKFCTEAISMLIKSAHTVISCQLRPEDSFHVSPWFVYQASCECIVRDFMQ